MSDVLLGSIYMQAHVFALGNRDFPWRSSSCRNVTAGPTGNHRGGNVVSPVVNIMMFSKVTVHASSERKVIRM